MLEDPRHADLGELAVGIERDDDRRFDLLLALADEKLLVTAEGGQFGAGISARLQGVAAGILTEAAATASAELHRPDEVDIITAAAGGCQPCVRPSRPPCSGSSAKGCTMDRSSPK